jgi:uncharacterized delta-60 repeat protein/uncharacterized repeat protein (TIGR01451 family)
MNTQLPLGSTRPSTQGGTNLAARLLLVLTLPALCLLALVALLDARPASSPEAAPVLSRGLALAAGPDAPDEAHLNGQFLVSVLVNGEWQDVGHLGYDEYPTERSLDLTDLDLVGQIQIRVEHAGETAVHIDSALLDGQSPDQVAGTAEDVALALKKLAVRDYDVIDARSRVLVLTYDDRLSPSALAIVARIEPEQVSQIPFQFPPENMYRIVDALSAFYTYVWDDQPGSLVVDGDLAGESLGEPFFKEYVEPGTGHPAGFAYGWVRNDDESLYVAIDFVPDNTMDGDVDYAKVYIKTPAGVHEFKVSVPEQDWGVPGFVYTERAAYQHKAYEFAIPLSEIGLGVLQRGTEVQLAFAAYGTAAPPPPSYPGPLDPSFGGDGIVTTTIGSYAEAHSVAMQPNGKIVVAGYASSNFALARYNGNGTLDLGFGTGGVVTTVFPDGTSEAYGVALQSDGRIVVAGYAQDGSGDWAIGLARYDTAGNLDSTFGPNGSGIVTTSVGSGDDEGRAVAVQPDDMIVVAGFAWGGTGSNYDFALARYDADGDLDTTFGPGNTGIVTTHIGTGSDWGDSVVVQPGGKIVVAGRATYAHGSVMAAVRYTGLGLPDLGFGTGGIVTAAVGSDSCAQAVGLQSNGKIVLAGYADFPVTDNDFALVRYTPDGNLDATFGTSGVVTTPFGGGSDDRIYDLAIRQNDVIIAAGANQNHYFAVAQYTKDGDPLGGFGSVGRVNSRLGPREDHGYATCLQQNGRIAVAGASNLSPTIAFAVVRYGRDLTIQKSVFPRRVRPGDTITYTLAFANTGATARNVGIDDQMPLSVSVTSIVSAGIPLTPTSTGPTVYAWEAGTMHYLDGGVITITGVVTDAVVAEDLGNVVTIDTNRWESELRNNSDVAILVVGERVYLPLALRNYP